MQFFLVYYEPQLNSYEVSFSCIHTCINKHEDKQIHVFSYRLTVCLQAIELA